MAPPASRATTVARVLPADEWHKLRDFPIATRGLPDPDTAALIVSETVDGTIKGVWGCFLQPMLDGLWVAPDARHTLVAGQLLREMKALLATYGIATAFTVIQDPAVMAIAHKAGFVPVPGDLWMLPVEKDR